MNFKSSPSNQEIGYQSCFGKLSSLTSSMGIRSGFLMAAFNPATRLSENRFRPSDLEIRSVFVSFQRRKYVCQSIFFFDYKCLFGSTFSGIIPLGLEDFDVIQKLSYIRAKHNERRRENLRTFLTSL